MKKLALISSHCDTNEKLEILKNNINLFKNLGIDTFVVSSIKIDVDCDFLFITKENPILSWPERAISCFNEFYHNDKILSISSVIEDYGWASLYQIKKIMNFASTYDYQFFYFLIYDLKIDDKIIDDINNNLINIVYPRKDFGTSKIYPSSLHFAIFNKAKLRLFSNLINKETYLKLGAAFAEDYIHNTSVALGLNHSDHVVCDLIQATNFDKVYNCSSMEDYKLFFNKDNGNFKVLLYEIKSNIKITINNDTYITSDPMFLIETEISCHDIENISIECNGIVNSYINEFNKLSKNHIFVR